MHVSVSPRAMRSSLMLVALLLVGVATAAVGQRVDTTPGAREMLNRLWSAAKERVDVVREQRRIAEGRGQSYAPTNTETFASLLNYIRDKVEQPPLLSVEENFLVLHKSVRELQAEVDELRFALKQCGFSKCQAGRAFASKPPQSAWAQYALKPVQGAKYTVLNVSESHHSSNEHVQEQHIQVDDP